MSYSVKEIFYTLQGEGHHAGTPAVFVRFSGCNLWSGREEHRARDAKRNRARCPMWCDTDFADGTTWTAESIAATVEILEPEAPLVVLTGGEPLLQVDTKLIAALRAHCPDAVIAVETNGTVEPKVAVGTRYGLDWVCVSPKKSYKKLKLTRGHELKVVVPDYDPNDYVKFANNFQHLFVSAEASTTGVGQSLLNRDNLARAAAWVMAHPEWKLTVQTHKLIGVP